MATDIPLIDISTQPIELCKLLKIANMVSGGGEAKIVISQGFVLVNGAVEFQKRKKIYQDDIIEFNGDIIQANVAKKPLNLNPVEDSSHLTETNRVSAAVKKTKVKQAAKKVNIESLSSHSNDSNKEAYNESPRSKRKPISF